jgi:predicted metalloprotease with PDZ domain
MKIKFLSLLFFAGLTLSQAAPTVEYFVSFPEPHTHYAEVQMKVSGYAQPYVDFKLPVWTPGSYLIREFAKNVEGFSAKSDKQNLRYEKISKNTWRVYSENANTITVSYRVYAFEASVRTSLIDDSHAFLVGSNVFMFVPALTRQPLTVSIKPFSAWKEISTGMEAVGKDKFILQAPDYDILVDSPIEVGNHKILIFNADGGTRYEMAMYGETQYDESRLISDMKTVVEEAGKVVGENPNKRYVFLVHHYTQGSGGLEHLNSTVLDVARNTYQSNYVGFLSLVAHEYFHLWNVKRIRAKALGPFDYDNENYTHLLWVAEGFTTYYQNLILRRAGIIPAENFLNIMAGNVGTIENQPGNQVQSLAESSWDAWVKYYRTNENSNNTTVSYYTKGAVAGVLLDLEILGSTNGEKGLDDVMKLLYEDFYKKQKRGFTDEEMQQTAEKIAGKSLKEFFSTVINNPANIDYDHYFGYAGLRMATYPLAGTEGFLGTGFSGGKTTVSNVKRGTAAYTNGLNVNDEVLAINGLRMNSGEEINALVASRKVGEKLTFLISRDNLIKTLEITLSRNPQIRYTLEKMPSNNTSQEKIFRKWLRL